MFQTCFLVRKDYYVFFIDLYSLERPVTVPDSVTDAKLLVSDYCLTSIYVQLVNQLFFFLLSPCRNAFFEREKDCVEPVTIQLWK